ncbi:MAG: glycoside hydrolase family 2 protein, partial [Rariglobus sp.]|nr:glycoside hydrolase family 2 TIM barrel-domain containing protein [Rariglobus sp.]
MFNTDFACRITEPLVGQWGLLPDPMERGRRQAWWRKERVSGEFFPSYDDASFWPTTVPGAYQLLHPQLEFYEGLVIYRLRFHAEPAAQGQRVFLSFAGVADRCQVFLNGRWVGAHDGPYTPFSCEITAALSATGAENRLLVYVDCKRQADGVPGEIHDWFHYGGIHGAVEICRVPSVFVQEAALETILMPEGQVRLALEVRLFGAERETHHPVIGRLLDAGGHEITRWTGAATAGRRVRMESYVSEDKIHLWSPSDPKLYRLVVEQPENGDHWEDEVGLREVRTRGREILLNGEPIFLRGVCSWIADPQRGLLSASAKTAETLVGIARVLNANFLRAAHWPQSREFVRACNRAGILLWMEIPAYWLPDMAEPTQMHRALTCAAEMLTAFRNAPSIILWSVGNECVYHDVEKPQTNLAYFLRAAEFFHANDPTRLVTYTGGIEGTRTAHVEKICPVELVDQLDVIGINTYAGIHDGVKAGVEEIGDLAVCARQASAFGKPVILAENGIDGVKGEPGFDFGEARQ